MNLFSYRIADVLCFLPALSGSAWAGAHPNFSGTWKLNAAESEYPNNNVPTKLIRVVQQDGSELRFTVERELNGKTDNADYDLTIRESIPAGDPESNIWAHWKGDIAVVTMIAANGVRQTESWKLSEDGRKIVDMTVVRRTDGSEVTIRRVFDKQ